MKGLLSAGQSHPKLDNVGSEIRDANPSRACYALSIYDEELICNRQRLAKLFQKITVVIPADATFSLVKETEAPENKTSGTDAYQINIGFRRREQVLPGFVVDLRASMKQSSHDDHIVQFRRVD